MGRKEVDKACGCGAVMLTVLLGARCDRSYSEGKNGFFCVENWKILFFEE